MSSKKAPKNILFIITDQQTWIQNWDPKWAKENLPAMQRLMKNGLAFNRAHCNSCTCSPSRTTLFTGTYPAHHRVTQVLGFDDPTSMKQIMQQTLASNYQNMGKMMESAGYQVGYKGKWHLTKPVVYLDNSNRPVSKFNPIDQLYWTPADVKHISDKYRFNDWNYPDAGDDMEIFNFGGGDVNNDGRFVDGKGQSAWYGYKIPEKDRIEASTVEYLNNYKSNYGDQPFFLTVSLVNPHDVLAYPGIGPNPAYIEGGYKDSDFENIPVELPETWNESLETKPTVQQVWREVCQANGPINNPVKAKKYVQFYAYLSSLVDGEINKVLDALEANGLTEDTLIVRISDHGDMAMSHGMQRQKMYNVYRQSLNIPMIFSNPILFPEAQSTNAFAGLIDLMPTLANFVGLDSSHWTFQGKDLSPILSDPNSSVQDYIHFTYDDAYLTSPDPAEMGPCHIRCIIEDHWKYAVYFDPNYGQKAEYEMYDLKNDPLETRNLAHEKYSAGYEKERQRLHERLTAIMIEKGTTPDAIIWPKISGMDVLATEPDAQAKIIKY
jgi:arylsulfatase A-like enzyme